MPEMITSELEYQATRAAAERFEHALATDESAVSHLPVEMQAVLRRSVEGQLHELQEQLAEYEQRQTGAQLPPAAESAPRPTSSGRRRRARS
jgi:hypothetical protein